MGERILFLTYVSITGGTLFSKPVAAPTHNTAHYIVICVDKLHVYPGLLAVKNGANRWTIPFNPNGAEKHNANTFQTPIRR